MLVYKLIIIVINKLIRYFNFLIKTASFESFIYNY